MKRALLVQITLLMFMVTACSGTPTVVTEPAQTAPTPTLDTAPLKVIYSATLEEGAVSSHTYFVDRFAVEMLPDADEVDAIFDLSSKSWKEMDSGKTVRMSDCESWVNTSVERTQTSLTKLEDGFEKRFVESMLNPNFEIEARGSTSLVLKNEFITYKITSSQSLPASTLSRFFAYDRMNGCRKAMLFRQLPPIPQWAVDKELEDRGMFPNEMLFTLRTLKGDNETRISVIVEEMTDAEQALVKSLLNK